MNTSKARILIVDDEPKWGETSKLALEERGYIVEWVQSMEEAYHHASRKRFALVVINSALAFAEGTSPLKRIIRRYPRSVIILSDIHSISVAVKAFKVGADYQDKPFEVSNLVHLVDRLVRGRGTESVPAT